MPFEKCQKNPFLCKKSSSYKKGNFFHISDHSAIIEEEECFAISQMMQHGQRDLLKHPLTEAFVYLKWEKLNCAFYLSSVYQVFLALLVTLTAFIEVQSPTVS